VRPIATSQHTEDAFVGSSGALWGARYARVAVDLGNTGEANRVPEELLSGGARLGSEVGVCMRRSGAFRALFGCRFGAALLLLWLGLCAEQASAQHIGGVEQLPCDLARPQARVHGRLAQPRVSLPLAEPPCGSSASPWLGQRPGVLRVGGGHRSSRGAVAPRDRSAPWPLPAPAVVLRRWCPPPRRRTRPQRWPDACAAGRGRKTASRWVGGHRGWPPGRAPGCHVPAIPHPPRSEQAGSASAARAESDRRAGWSRAAR
jgi:hypothetical protein